MVLVPLLFFKYYFFKVMSFTWLNEEMSQISIESLSKQHKKEQTHATTIPDFVLSCHVELDLTILLKLTSKSVCFETVSEIIDGDYCAGHLLKEHTLETTVRV